MDAKTIEILEQIESLLHRGTDTEIQTAIQLLLPLVKTDYSLYSFLAKAYVLARDPVRAIEACENMIKGVAPGIIESSTLVHWAYYWKAAAFAISQNRSELLISLKKAYSLDKNLREYAINQVEFLPYFNDSEFLSTVELKPRPQLGPELAKLVNFLKKSLYFEAFQFGLELERNTLIDRASCYDGLIAALSTIVKDIGEHGDSNLEIFGGGRVTAMTFSSELQRITLLRRGLNPEQSDLGIALIWSNSYIS